MENQAKPEYYEVYIEGSLHRSLAAKSSGKAQAMKLKTKFEKEGWNVKIIAVYKTILGELGKEI